MVIDVPGKAESIHIAGHFYIGKKQGHCLMMVLQEHDRLGAGRSFMTGKTSIIEKAQTSIRMSGSSSTTRACCVRVSVMEAQPLS